MNSKINSSDWSNKNLNVSNTPGNMQDTNMGSKQKGGGGHGYDVEREQSEVNKEREEMHQERDPKKINIEEPQRHPGTESDPGRETPQPGKPGKE